LCEKAREEKRKRIKAFFDNKGQKTKRREAAIKE